MSQHCLVLPQRDQWKARTPHQLAGSSAGGGVIQAACNAAQTSPTIFHTS